MLQLKTINNMKRILLFILIVISFNFYSDAQCTVSLSATDSLVCLSDTISLTATTSGPGISMMASNLAGNNHRGNMFDIVATNAITILSFDVSPMGNTTIEIYYKVNSWNGFANTPAAWTFIGSAPVVFTGGFVPVDVPVNITIPAGQTYSFYVTSNTSAVSLNYSNGTAVGNVYSSDANITFLEGGGLEYPFTQGTGAVYEPRIWNGNIHYCLANQPISYLWGQGQTSNSIVEEINSSTQYTIQSTISGCPILYDTLDIVVSVPYVDAGLDISVCQGDSVTLEVTGPFSYSWDNSVINGQAFLPITQMDYIVSALDSAGCYAVDTIFVEPLDLPLVDAGSDLNVCLGSTITLSGSGADSYVWDNNVIDNVAFEPTFTNTYVVTGTSINGCQSADTMIVSVYDFLTSITVSGDVILIGNPGEGVTYQWYNCGSNQVIPGETGQAFLATENGTYAVIISNGDCTDTTNCVTISAVGIGKQTLDNMIFIHPNPNNGKFVVNAAVNTDLEITDLNGRIVKQIRLSNMETELELTTEQNGVYLLKFMKDGQFLVKRIIKQ